MSNETKERIERSISEFVKFLQKVQYNKLKLGTIEHCAFGSKSNGFGTEKSDVDYTILTNCYVNELQMLQFTKQEMEQIQHTRPKFKRFEIVRLVTTARIPVMNIVDTVEQVEYDFCCNNILGIINTRLLNQYANLHKFVQMGGILLKVWGKIQGLINTNTFSSYQFILMWIAFLQREYGLPNLQDPEYIQRKYGDSGRLQICRCKNNIDDPQNPSDRFSTNTCFIVDPLEIEERMKNCRIQTTSLSTLLRDFWKYYEPGGKFSSQNLLISIHLPEKQLKKKYRDDMFQTSDPFDITHDPGARVKNGTDISIFEKTKLAFQKDALNAIKEFFEVKK